jgi:carbonic anhydrase/acetyltransferase-like protein (isoleucine patch superfamily)
MPVYPYGDMWPRIAEDVFIAPHATVAGDVELGAGSSVWFGTVIRGDVFPIRIGARTNVQDNSVIHVTTDTNATIIGQDVTIGHRAILHGCTVEDRCLIGMGAIVMDRAVIGAGSMVGAGALVTEGTIVPAGSLVLGSPARVRRPLTEEELSQMLVSASHYVEVARIYAGRLGWGQGHS